MATADTDAHPGTEDPGFWQRAKLRLVGSQQARDAAELKADAEEAGCREIASHEDRDRCTLKGTLRHVTLRPHGGVVALEAELYDGSGTVTLVWLGRRQIAGITAGRTLTVHGRLSCSDGRRTLFNPNYELSA
jgi:RecG-like helicase